MGKGGKDKKILEKVKQPQPEIQQSQQEQDIESQEGSEDLIDEEDDDDEQLLKKIQQQIIGSDEAVKLSWGAIHALKQQENELNQQMDNQMRKIQQKFDKLKQPLYNQIAKVASGHPIKKEYYTKHEHTKGLSSKIKPQRIPGFWVGVLESIGLFVSELDKQMFEKCIGVFCSINKDEEKDEETIRVELEFQENQYFKQKKLLFVVNRKETAVDVPQKSRINFIKAQTQETILSEIFDPNQNPFKLYEYASDFLRAYNQSSKIGDQLDDQQLEDEDNSDDEEDDADEQSQDVGKPVKKRKTVEKTNGKTEKPQCNQQ